MSTYIPTAINEKAYEQAKQDAMATYAPSGAALGSGFLAGFVATWLPGLLVLPLLYVYRLTWGASRWMSAQEKGTAALNQLVGNLGSYAKFAIWVGLLLGAYGVFQAVLRKRSCINNRYSTIELARYGEMRLSLDAKLTIFGFPILAVISLWLANQLNVLIVAIFIIIVSGMFYNMLWQKLFGLFLRLTFKPSWDEATALALRVMVPRHVGWNQVKVTQVSVNRDEKTVRVEGEFENDIAEKEARNVITHFMRGYHPIYIVNSRKHAS